MVDSLFKEMDTDGSGFIDIDEFMTFIEIADGINPENEKAKESAYRIRKAKLNLNKEELLFIFKRMPSSFMKSVS